MENKHSSRDSAVLDRPLSLPHFDEDATLLSARPVVPLYEVSAETRSRRRVILGLTIVAAILGGAISAVLLLMHSEQNLQSAARTGESQLEVSSSGAAGRTISESPQVKVPLLTERLEEPRLKEVPSTRDSSIKMRQTETSSRRSTKPAAARNPDQQLDDDFDGDERSLRRIERRNARREARREHRRRREQTGDDLLRIREIFEGSPRP
jgi:hypothetical protein